MADSGTAETGTDEVSEAPGEGAEAAAPVGQEVVSLGVKEGVEDGTGDDSAEPELGGSEEGDGDSAAGDGVRDSDGRGQEAPAEVVCHVDETALREFDYEACYAVAYAGLGFCGGAVLGSVFTRGWQRWGGGTVTKGE